MPPFHSSQWKVNLFLITNRVPADTMKRRQWERRAPVLSRAVLFATVDVYQVLDLFLVETSDSTLKSHPLKRRIRGWRGWWHWRGRRQYERWLHRRSPALLGHRGSPLRKLFLQSIEMGRSAVFAWSSSLWQRHRHDFPKSRILKTRAHNPVRPLTCR